MADWKSSPSELGTGLTWAVGTRLRRYALVMRKKAWLICSGDSWRITLRRPLILTSRLPSFFADVDLGPSRELPCQAHSYWHPILPPYHLQMHPNPLYFPVSAPLSSPLLGPRRFVFCLLAFSGHVVKPTALDASFSPSKPQFSHLGNQGHYHCPTGSEIGSICKALAYSAWNRLGAIPTLPLSLPPFLTLCWSFPPLIVKSPPLPKVTSLPSKVLSNPGVFMATGQTCPQHLHPQQPGDPHEVWLGSGGCQLAACPILSPLQMRRPGNLTSFIFIKKG